MEQNPALDITQQDFENAVAAAMNGTTCAQINNMSKETLEGLYALAYNLYTAGNHADAETVFRALCLYDHTDVRFWMGLGGSRQALGHYQEAVDAYSMAGLATSLNDPTPFMFATECFLKMGDKEKAVGTLESMPVMSPENPRFAGVHAKASALLKLLKPQK